VHINLQWAHELISLICPEVDRIGEWADAVPHRGLHSRSHWTSTFSDNRKYNHCLNRFYNGTTEATDDALIISFAVTQPVLSFTNAQYRPAPRLCFIQGHQSNKWEGIYIIPFMSEASETKFPNEVERQLIKSAKCRRIHNPNHKVVTYYGLPFAAPPVGNLRFKAPLPPLNLSHKGIIDARKAGPSCMVDGNFFITVGNVTLI
jgi:Carboxylesterase family